MPKKKRLSSKPVSEATHSHFPVVGIGASAGGLEAFQEMLSALPSNTGMAFVLIQHLDPTHASMLAPLLSRKSILPVTQVTDGLKLEPNHVYVIPPNSTMGIQDGKLTLSQRLRDGEKHMPIDYFFESLAEDRKDGAIGVVLSGTATDGTFGLKAIKAEGGICFAQDTESAQYDGMPSSAIAAGCVDFALPPRQIAAELTRIARHPRADSLAATPPDVLPGGPDNDVDIRKLLLLVRSATGADFTHYKSSTIHRRIARRMLLRRVASVREYCELVLRDRSELDALYQDVLIHVTSFFRDPETFRILEAQIIPKLIAGKPEGEALRIWVPGCSSGEEAYSIAMLVAEHMAERASSIKVQIFGTDLSESCVQNARAGVYSGKTLADVSPERLARFFVKAHGGYQVVRSLRETCTFARQDLTHDPPFSRIDLISCRNVLIYLEPLLQKRILAAFHYALNPKGLLLLGKSESLRGFPDLFTLAERKASVYRKQATGNRTPVRTAPGPQNSAQEPAKLAKQALSAMDLQKEADRIVWSRYAHAGVIVDENLNILNFRGDTGPYLTPASGPASLHLLKMAKPDLLVGLRTAFQRAKKENAPARREGLRVTSGDQSREIVLEILPLSALDTTDRHFLILFEEANQNAPRPAPPPAAHDKTSAAKLRRELAATREYLQAIIEEQDTTYEELKAANEEALSNNEELQTANEELETAKEELQATNEELVTLNDQQASTNTELSKLNDDLKNVLEGVRIPILMLGNDRRIRRFTTSAEKPFNLLATDMGRSIHDLRPNLNLPDLEPLIARTIDTSAAQEQEVRDLEGRYYSLGVQPYRTSDNKIDGVLISLVDTDAIKRSLEEVRRARDYASAIVETVREPLVVLDSGFNVVTANHSFYRMLQVSPADVEKHRLFDLADGWDSSDLRNLLERVVSKNAHFDGFKMTHTFPKIGSRALLLNARKLEWESDSPGMILLAMEDLTERDLTAQALQESRERLRVLTAGLLTSQEEESRRLSRELHDDLNQKLAMLTVELEAMERNPIESAELIRRQLASLRNRTAAISDDVRRTAHQLHPSTVEHLGLPAALRSLCRDLTKQERMQCAYRQRGKASSIPAEVALCLYRVAQESLRNAARHSGAKRATVSLVLAETRILLAISDAGVGFNQEVARAKKGLGLVSMEERARLVVGTLTIRSKPGAGTRVVIEVPLPPAPEKPGALT